MIVFHIRILIVFQVKISKLSDFRYYKVWEIGLFSKLEIFKLFQIENLIHFPN